jgi:hypothetical protein
MRREVDHTEVAGEERFRVSMRQLMGAAMSSSALSMG